jgi:transketolase
MRGVFLDNLFQKMETDETIFFLTADMGINLVERFEEKFPDRFLNVGIAEQNLIGIAAGLAESGMRPYVYTISNFLVHRCFEQIRNDIVIHKLPIVLIGTSTGYDNGSLGPTHHMLEDWGAMANFPGMKIYAPYNKTSAEKVFDKTYSERSPSYIRIAKGGGLEEFAKRESYSKNKTAAISYGSALKYAMEYSSSNQIELIILEELGNGSFTDLDRHCLEFQELIVIEDHFPSTGMFSYVSQWSIRRNLRIQISSISPQDYSLNVGYEFKDFLNSRKLIE